MNYNKMTKLQLWIEVCKRNLVGNDCTWYPNRWTKSDLIALLENN